MLKALMEKVNNMKYQMENFSREMETIRKIKWKSRMKTSYRDEECL